MFLTHFTYERVPKGGRLIYCLRNPIDLLYSLYLFIDTLWLLKGRVSLKTCLDYFGSIHIYVTYLCSGTDGGRSGDGQKPPVEVQQRIEKEW